MDLSHHYQIHCKFPTVKFLRRLLMFCSGHQAINLKNSGISETSLVKAPLAFVVFQEQSKVLDKGQIENFDCEAKHNHKG